jgi:hypothetical protein
MKVITISEVRSLILRETATQSLINSGFTSHSEETYLQDLKPFSRFRQVDHRMGGRPGKPCALMFFNVYTM